MKIWGIRQGMIGDSIMSLPVLNFLEKKYPGSYKFFVIGKKFSQSAPLYINHPLIDKIHILQNDESLGLKDEEIKNSCDLSINVNPEHKFTNWYTKYSCVEETFRMSGFELEELKRLPIEEHKPRLYKWWKESSEINKNYIAIFPFAGYGKISKRSPSKNWWESLLQKIVDNYKILHFGSENEPVLSNHENYHKLTHLPFFDMIKLALTTKISIGTDSGSSWVIGAYGHNQINLLSDEPVGSNGLIPENYLSNSVNFFGKNNCDEILHESIIDIINSI
jgi:ADP-heptose:LPS heptosyltransferase